MTRFLLTRRIAAVALGAVLVTTGAAAANAAEEKPAADSPLEQLKVFTNPSELNISRNKDGSWTKTFTNRTGEQAACAVHVLPRDLALEVLDWIIRNPEKAAEGSGMSFGDELNAKREAANRAGQGTLTLHMSDGKSEEPEEIAFSQLPTDDSVEYRALAMCKSGDLFGDGDAFIELTPGVSPLIGSIESLPLGSLDKLPLGSFDKLPLGSSSKGEDSDGAREAGVGSLEKLFDAKLIWDGGSLGSVAGSSGSGLGSS